MNRRILTLAALAALSCVTLLMDVNDAGAIPAFARKYQISCTTCHAPFPRLKPYGEEFAGSGFRMEEGQEPVRAVYDVGDPLLHLPRDLPLAARMEGYLSYKEDADAEVDLEWPWVWKILSGGPIGPKASYYFYFLMERGDVVGLEDAYLQLNDAAGSGFDLVFGQFQVCDPLFKRELRLERFDYLIYKTQVGDSPVDLTYDRGLMFLRTLPGDLAFTAMILNGNGIGGALDAGVSDFKNHDDDKYKNFALRLARQTGPARLGGFGYFGRTQDNGGTLLRNDTYYLGADLMFDAGAKSQLNAQFLYREDDDPFYTGGDTHRTRGGFLEAHYFPQGQDGRWALSFLYNLVASDDDAADRETISLTANHLIDRNLRLLLEGGKDVEADKLRLSIGLISAF
ncbi:MAG: hypothetical protein Q7W56_09870 [Candidatus Latescibacteria bacterium]|nr:hypothetical protein [Candidatus Latescibacterota bacterium]